MGAAVLSHRGVEEEDKDGAQSGEVGGGGVTLSLQGSRDTGSLSQSEDY